MKSLLIFFAVVIVAFLALGIGILSRPDFGRTPTGERLARVQASPHYKDGAFRPLEPIVNHLKDGFVVSMYKFIFEKHPELRPQQPLPAVKTDLKSLDPNEDLIIWFGHSSFYMQSGGKKILADPVFSGHASPLASLMKAFEGTDVINPSELPDLDILLISHDHWDHLDYKTVSALKGRVKRIICGLGVGEHFEYWGFPAEILTEEDWDTEIKIDDNLTVAVLPARHYSGRFIKTNQSLPVSFALITPQHKIFYSGDTGWGSHLEAVAQKYGPFDYAVIDAGQYDEQWHDVHLHPEEVVKTAQMLGAKNLLPAHNSKFVLANHPWQEPLERLTKLTENSDINLQTPLIGQPLSLNGTTATLPWWKDLK